MISDVLHDAVREINEYLKTIPRAYPPGDALTKRIVKCRNEMDSIRAVLDTPPDVRLQGRLTKVRGPRSVA